jgi:hypothetical protein
VALSRAGVRPTHPSHLPDTVRSLIRDLEPGGLQFIQLMTNYQEFDPSLTPNELMHLAQPVAVSEADDLRRSQAWWVTEDLCDLIETATPSVPDESSLSLDSLRTPVGFVVFARPLMVVGERSAGHPSPMDAVAWSVFTDDEGTTVRIKAISWLSTMDAHDERLVEIGRTWSGLYPTDATWTRGRGFWWPECPLNNPTPAWYLKSMGAGQDVAEQYASAAWLRRLLTVIWSLSTQEKLTEDEDAVVPRHTQKRAVRAGIPAAVKILKLRQRKSKGKGGSGESWTLDHRILVTGYWKMQPYGPGGTLRRPVWIPPHIRGPEDAPLDLRDKAFVLD